jgi:hypothetical protein
MKKTDTKKSRATVPLIFLVCSVDDGKGTVLLCLYQLLLVSEMYGIGNSGLPDNTIPWFID